MLEIDQIIAFRDNYVFFVTDVDSRETVIIDPGEPNVVIEYCVQHKIRPSYILNTHHHWDHTGGNLAIKNTFGTRIAGFGGDAYRIPGLEFALNDKNQFKWGNSALEVMHIPGHTTGHVAYYSPKDKVLFCGDTLFPMGCGMNFEGTEEQLYNSLLKLKNLPDETLVYYGHEYTAVGLRFAKRMEGNTEALQSRTREMHEGRAIPGTIAQEKATNPFLRCDSEAIKKTLGLPSDTPPSEVFRVMRGGKK